MCECWEFSCGHKTMAYCQRSKNRSFTEIDEEVTGDNDPFTETGDQPSTAKAKDRNCRSSAYSDSQSDRPPPFILPSPSLSSAASETDATSSAADVHSNSKIDGRECGPGPEVKHRDSSITPKLCPAEAKETTTACCDPSKQTTEKSDDQCYSCILEKVKNNSTFKQNERDAETRLYDELKRQGAPANNAASRDRHQTMREEFLSDAGPSARHTPGNPAYVNNAVDLGRGNPPRGGGGGRRHGSATAAPGNRGGHKHHHQQHHGSMIAPPSQQFYFQPQAQDRFFNSTNNYQGLEPPMPMSVPMFNPDAPYHTPGPLPQYTSHNIQYQHPNLNPYQVPWEPFVPQQYMYPPLETQMQYQAEGEGAYEQYQYDYPQLMQHGYGYFRDM